MSGALGGIGALAARGSQAFAGAQNIAQGLGGLLGFGSQGPVALGPFVFSGFEVPAEIAHGGNQAHAIHKMPGGGRVIDVTGRDDRPVGWSGTFLGPNASARATQLDALRIAGKALPLTWGSYNLRVVIVTLDLDTKQINAHVRYRISCEVLSINPTVAGAPSLLGSISASIGQAVGVVQGGIAQVQQVVGGVTQLAGAVGIRVPFLSKMSQDLSLASGAVGAVGSLAAAVPAAVTGAMNAAQNIASVGQSASTSALNWFSGTAPTNATSAVSAVTFAGDAVSTQAETAAVGAFSGQALAVASTPPAAAPQPVTVPNGLDSIGALNYLVHNGGVPTGAFTAVSQDGVNNYTFGAESQK